MVCLDLRRSNDFDGDMTGIPGVHDELDDAVLAGLLSASPQLRELRCTHWFHLRGTGLAPLARFRQLRRMELAECRGLGDGALTALSGLPRLRALDLSLWNSVISDDCDCEDLLGPAAVDDLASIPRLEALNVLGRCRMVRHDLTPLAALPALRRLGWGQTPGLAWEPEYAELTEADIAGVLGSVHRLAGLEKLSVWATEAFTDGALAAFRAGPGLRELRLAGSESCTGLGLGALVHAPGLRQLVLEEMESLTDEHLQVLAGHPTLEQVEVIRCPMISAHGEEELAAALARP